MCREGEVGTPYHIIVDEKTLETGIVSLQDRDTSAVVCIQHFVHQGTVEPQYKEHTGTMKTVLYMEVSFIQRLNYTHRIETSVLYDLYSECPS